MATVTADTVSTSDLFVLVKGTSTDYQTLLLCMKIDYAVIRRKFDGSKPEWALADALDYFLKNSCVGMKPVEIWRVVADALQESGDNQTAEKVRTKYNIVSKYDEEGPEDDYDSYYSQEQVMERINTDGNMQSLEGFERLKTTTALNYNEAIRKYREIHLQVNEILNQEEKSATKVLQSYKSKVEEHGNKCEIVLNELTKRISRIQKHFSDVNLKLSKSDCTAFAIMKKVDEEFVEIEKLLSNVTKFVESYLHMVPSETSDSVAHSEHVIHSLQALLRFNIEITVLSLGDGTSDQFNDEDDQYETIRPT